MSTPFEPSKLEPILLSSTKFNSGNMLKKLVTILTLSMVLLPTVYAQSLENEESGYLKAVINTEEALEAEKSNIFDASQSFVPDDGQPVSYSWDFGDGNKNEGIEVLHAFKNPGKYNVSLTITSGANTADVEQEIFAYEKLIILITDHTEIKDRVEIIAESAASNGSYIKLIESFGSSTEFISEEILAKKLTEESGTIQKANQILLWTKENAGLNAISRYIQTSQKIAENIAQKTLIIINNNVNSETGRLQRQFALIKPKEIIVAQEAILQQIMEGYDRDQILEDLDKGGYEYNIITAKTGKIRPWNFMSYFLNAMVTSGVPDNTIALLLLLPVIATIVAFMKQVVGITTFGIYTPSIITLSFLVIGLQAGLLTLAVAISVGALLRPALKKVRMLFIPKMAIVITVVTLALFGVLILSNYLGLFNAQFLSVAIFPMLILSTLVEKFISVKSGKGLSSATFLMASTVLVSIIAFFVVGGEIALGLFTLKLDFVKNSLLSYPELVLLFLVINFFLGKWSGLRILEKIRFREVLRHIEEE
jgi:hypothetical protein